MIIEKSRIITTEKEEPEEETESPLLIELILKEKNGLGESLLCVALGGAISFSSGQPSHPEEGEPTRVADFD